MSSILIRSALLCLSRCIFINSNMPYRIVTGIAPPFVQHSTKLINGTCLTGVPCLKVSLTFFFLHTNWFLYLFWIIFCLLKKNDFWTFEFFLFFFSFKLSCCFFTFSFFKFTPFLCLKPTLVLFFVIVFQSPTLFLFLISELMSFFHFLFMISSWKKEKEKNIHTNKSKRKKKKKYFLFFQNHSWPFWPFSFYYFFVSLSFLPSAFK